MKTSLSQFIMLCCVTAIVISSSVNEVSGVELPGVAFKGRVTYDGGELPKHLRVSIFGEKDGILHGIEYNLDINNERYKLAEYGTFYVNIPKSESNYESFFFRAYSDKGVYYFGLGDIDKKTGEVIIPLERTTHKTMKIELYNEDGAKLHKGKIHLYRKQNNDLKESVWHDFISSRYWRADVDGTIEVSVMPSERYAYAVEIISALDENGNKFDVINEKYDRHVRKDIENLIVLDTSLDSQVLVWNKNKYTISKPFFSVKLEFDSVEDKREYLTSSGKIHGAENKPYMLYMLSADKKRRLGVITGSSLLYPEPSLIDKIFFYFDNHAHLSQIITTQGSDFYVSLVHGINGIHKKYGYGSGKDYEEKLFLHPDRIDITTIKEGDEIVLKVRGTPWEETTEQPQ